MTTPTPTPPSTAAGAADPATVLAATGLGKRYGDTAIFSHVDLQVRRGEFVAIVGDSGVGKSTLLNCLAGLDSWDTGRITTLPGATDLGALDDAERALWRRRHVGFVFQAFHVLPHLDVAQNVALPLMLLGENDPVRVQHMLDAVGLAGLGSRLPQQLSGGQLQRVAIARALVTRPACVLADEPTGNLDRATADGVFQLMLRLAREQGTAFVMVTHDQQLAGRCDRVVRMNSGVLS